MCPSVKIPASLLELVFETSRFLRQIASFQNITEEDWVNLSIAISVEAPDLQMSAWLSPLSGPEYKKITLHRKSSPTVEEYHLRLDGQVWPVFVNNHFAHSRSLEGEPVNYEEVEALELTPISRLMATGIRVVNPLHRLLTPISRLMSTEGEPVECDEVAQSCVPNVSGMEFVCHEQKQLDLPLPAMSMSEFAELHSSWGSFNEGFTLDG